MYSLLVLKLSKANYFYSNAVIVYYELIAIVDYYFVLYYSISFMKRGPHLCFCILLRRACFGDSFILGFDEDLCIYLLPLPDFLIINSCDVLLWSEDY